MWTMLSALCRICEDLQLPMPLPAERANRVGCCNPSLGRAVEAALLGEETSRVLETCLPRAILTAGISGKNWGGDIFPVYEAAQRAPRAHRWDTPTPLPQRPLHPSAVTTIQADSKLLSRQICQACAKQKCLLCSNTRRNYSLTVDQCCQVHHRPDDGLKRQCCGRHRLTRCGTCPNAAACCAEGHHKQQQHHQQQQQTPSCSNSEVQTSTEDDEDADQTVRPCTPPASRADKRPFSPASPAASQGARRKRRRIRSQNPSPAQWSSRNGNRRKCAVSSTESFLLLLFHPVLRKSARPVSCPHGDAGNVTL